MIRNLAALFLILTLNQSFSVSAKDWVYVVAQGDNIWNISKRYLKDINHFKGIQKLNNIPVAKQLTPGTVLRIPLEWVKSHSAKVMVKSLSGKSNKVSDKQTTQVNIQTVFTLGDELRVTPNSTITLVFADKTEITLSDDVLIKFDHLSEYGITGMVDTRVRLQGGKVEIRAAKQIGAGSRLDIQTASAITSVRGTIFRVGVNKKTQQQDDFSIVEVLEGEVAVSAGNESVGVKQGFGLKVEKGKELQQPVKLLLAPTILNFSPTVEIPEQDLTWQSIDLADLYNIQIATDKNFSDIKWQKYQKTTSINLPKLDDGDYFLRISAMSENGMEGLTESTSFTVNIYPKAPKLNFLKQIYIDTPEPLTWSKVDNIEYYIIQIAKDASFSQIVIDTQVDKTSYSIKSPLSLGTYYWRVASLQGDNLLDKGPFSDIQKFAYSTILTAPQLRTSRRNKNIEITWGDVPNNQHIELQTAPTSDFEKITNQQLNSDSSYKFVLENDESIYIRAKAVLTEYKISSEWSNYCKISGKLEICNK